MPNSAQQIHDILFRINEIRKKVSTGKKIFEAVADPIDKYFTAQRGVAKSADENLQKILGFSLLADKFSDYLYDNRNKLDNPTWLIENLTEASVGAEEKNKEAITTIEELPIKLNAVIDLTDAADGLANAVAALIATDPSNLLTSLSAANGFVLDAIKKKNSSTRKNLEKVNNIVTNALIEQTVSLLQAM